ncbi:ribose-5-phosphate isomerase RpiA [Halodurantibacterium flavum]|uniref:Ribose-5-phosphate isomerase A n=1 Tax=Halodurantibacterium flavum TaxID=1382802 RepID=A0ABW4S3X2_9RHOB
MITENGTHTGTEAGTGQPGLSPADTAKNAAACRAVDFVEDGMRVGLGTGSTAAFMVRRLGQLVREAGLRVTGVPTSSRTAALARDEGIHVVTLAEAGWLDLTIDGADEFDPAFNLIKGGGGAHLQEKVVATASDRMIVIADPDKDVAQLGAFPLPVEVLQFGWEVTQRLIAELLEGQDVASRGITRRMGAEGPFVTDEGNFILDLHLGRIGNPPALALALNQIAGVVENGLFIDICDVVVIGHPDGHVTVRDRHSGRETSHGAVPDNAFSGLGG